MVRSADTRAGVARARVSRAGDSTVRARQHLDEPSDAPGSAATSQARRYLVSLASSRFKILPAADIGSASTKITRLGTL